MTKHTLTGLVVAAAVCAAPLSARADVVTEWNRALVETAAGANPFAQARFAAIVQLAVFEAVNAVAREYEPYLGTTSASSGASPEAAAAAAAHAVLIHYFPASAAGLNARLANSLAAIPDGQSEVDGIAAGQAAAAALIALRAADGAGSPLPYVPVSAPGFWQPTPPAFGPAVLRHWGHVLPFGIARTDQFRSDPPPALTSSRYRRDYDEVRRVGDVNSVDRPGDRTDVARFYAATSAVQAWNWAAEQATCEHAITITQRARLLALLNMAISDGLVASMETKYHYQLWRPVTAIRAGDTDGHRRTKADPSYLPLVTTPSFPSYPSAHASASYAARVVLDRWCGGGRRHVITLTNPAVPGVALHYRSFEEITSDIDDARVFGGIHFRFDQRAGAVQGRRIGRYVAANNLRKRKSE
jgi:hypothetical protein